MAEAGKIYISVVPVADGVGKQVEAMFGGKTADKAGTSFGAGFTKKVNNVVKGTLVASMAAVGGLAATALAKGFGRLKSIDQATAKLSGLGHSAETVEKIMANALNAVRGTAFGMDEAATSAAGAVAAGIKPGKDLERILTLVGDAATIAGVDMASMGAIWNKVAASNKVQMDVINQLHDQGVPALALLADELGVTAEAASKMASQGKIDFATFAAAMESGMGGAALKSGETFQGAMDNVFAALGRIGANFLGPLFDESAGALQALQAWLGPLEDGAKEVGKAFSAWVADVGPKVIAFVQNLIAAVQNVVGWLQRNADWLKAVVVALAAFGSMIYVVTMVKNVTAAFKVFNAVLAANKLMLLITGITAVVAALVWFFTQTELGRAIVETVVGALVAAWEWLASVFQIIWETVLLPVIDGISAAFSFLWENVLSPIFSAIGVAFALLAAAITAVWEGVLAPVFVFIGDAFTALWTGFIEPVAGFIMGAFETVGSVAKWLYNSVFKPVFDSVGAVFSWLWNSAIKPVIGWITGAFETIGDVTEDIFGGIRDFIGDIFSGLVGIVKGPINAVIGVMNMAIDGLNAISIDVPEWARWAVGGASKIGFDIPRIPELAMGGITSGDTLARIGEGKYQEAVIPLGGPQFARLADALSDKMGHSGGDTYNITDPNRDPLQTLEAIKNRRIAMRRIV